MKIKHILNILPLSLPFLTGCSGIYINGAGATFPNPIYQRWFSDYSDSTGNKVNYQSVGSGAGIRQFVKGTVHFAASDEPIKIQDSVKVGAGVVQIPLTAGSIALAYNKPGCNLRLTQKQLVSIYEGETKDWSELGCSKGVIVPVHRSDGSGTTAVFTESLSAFSPGWKSEFGYGKSVRFPVGVASKGNEGIAGTLKSTPGSIGYVNFSYALKGGLQVAALQNKYGNFITPSAKSGTEALKYINLDPLTLSGSNPNPEGPGSYPITTLTWFLAYRTSNGNLTSSIRNLLYYSLSDKAQKQAESLGYVPLNEGIRSAARQAISQISQ